MEMVRVHQVGKTYKNGVCALNDVNFNINKGEFVSLIGMSGAGKTSLIRIINGSLKPSKGEVIVSGNTINKLKGREKMSVQKNIGTIYQDFCLVDTLTCFQNVLNGCLAERNVLQVILGKFTKEQQKYAEYALNRVGLADKKDVMAKELSGGQKQRVAIARAIMQKPQILLADEVVASLDPYTAEQILDLIKELQEEYGLTVIMNSHNVAASLKYSDRIIGIKNGTTVLDKAVIDITEDDVRQVYKEND